MNIIFSLLISILITAGVKIYSQTIEGNYFLGEERIIISADYNNYIVTYSDKNTSSKIVYEENTPENEQIWLEYINGKRTGTFVFKQDYSTGIYTNYQTQKEYYIKKIY
jgi:hypothetical protein